MSSKLSIPLIYLAEINDTIPWIDYHRGYVLYNYKLVDEDEKFSYDNLEEIRCFTFWKDEPGFILCHAAINGHTPDLIGAIENIF